MAWLHREPEAFKRVEPTRRATLPPLAAEATPNPPLQRTRRKRRAAERRQLINCYPQSFLSELPPLAQRSLTRWGFRGIRAEEVFGHGWSSDVSAPGTSCTKASLD